jgi:hypothetical protein
MSGDGVGVPSDQPATVVKTDAASKPQILPPSAGTIPSQQEPNYTGGTYKNVKLKRDRLDFINTFILTLAFCAALYAGIEGGRLANLTQTAIDHADTAAKTQHADTLLALQKAEDANVTAKTTAERQAADTATALGLSKAAADAARMSANEAIADRRPFVGIDGSEIAIDEPLTFQNGWATVEFKVILRNVGKSVAFNVTTHMSQLQLSPLVQEGIPFNTSQLSARLRDRIHCSETIVRQWTDAGTMILPGGTNVVDIAPYAAHTVLGVDLSLGTDAWLTFCVSYSDDNNRPHATGFVLAFARDKWDPIFPDNGIVPGKFRIYPWGGK